jgi:hypothetical protein
VSLSKTGSLRRISNFSFPKVPALGQKPKDLGWSGFLHPSPPGHSAHRGLAGDGHHGLGCWGAVIGAKHLQAGHGREAQARAPPMGPGPGAGVGAGFPCCCRPSGRSAWWCCGRPRATGSPPWAGRRNAIDQFIFLLLHFVRQHLNCIIFNTHTIIAH